MKKIFCFLLCSFLIFNGYSNSKSLNSANRKTALRYLQLAKNYLNQNDWANVQKNCDNGIRYDDSVADLYYLKALSLFNLNAPRYEIIPVIRTSLETTQWVDYNMSNARIFYADLLCSTGKPEDAIAVLDKEPLIFSSDAEYVRIKSLYEINTPESITQAEEKIDSVRRVYPNDTRFFYLFFNYEYNLLFVENEEKTQFEKQNLSPIARKIADSFIAFVPNYDNSYPDLEIFASLFAEGETQQRLLKAFNARGFNHILYPIAALDAQIISEQEAFDYFLTFIDGEIDEKILMQFYLMIQDENIKNNFDEYLNAFNGTLLYDTNNTLEENLIVKYERGRPQKISFDFDNDESLEWEVDCDFGEPKKINVFNHNAVVTYKKYPNVNSIVFNLMNKGIQEQTVYEIIDETYQSKPFDIIKSPEINSTDFYVIDVASLDFGNSLFDSDKIVASSNIMDKPSSERENARIKFSILNGIPYEASYYVGEQEYAHAYFTDEPNSIVRKVDKDDDGIFETTEYYMIDDDSMNISEKDKSAITTNIWGSPLSDASLYLASIDIDRNADTIVDFSQSYFKNDGVFAQWDSDFDGQIDVQYRKSYDEEKKNLTEEFSYYVMDWALKKEWVRVNLVNSIPQSLIKGENSYPVISGENKNFFWIEKTGNPNYEQNIIVQVNQYAQGQMFQMEEATCYIHVIRIGENIFAKVQDKDQNDENVSSGELLENEN